MSADPPPAGGFVHGLGLPAAQEKARDAPPPAKPQRRNWRKRGIVAVSILAVLLVVFFALPKQLIQTKTSAAVTGCVYLAKACDSFVTSEANPRGEWPKTLNELHRPPWGGSSFLPNGESDLRDPWGNPYVMQPRKKADGEPYLLILTNAPDGTMISQHGSGLRAVPAADRAPLPSEGKVMAATWLNRGTALGILLGFCLGAGAVVAWYSTRERPKQEAKVIPPPKDAPQPQQFPSPADILKAEKEKALASCKLIARAIDSYALSSSNPGITDDERLPNSPENLVNPGWSTSFLPNELHNLKDPWDKFYQFRRLAREDGTPYIVVFTLALDGEPISQHRIGEKALPKQ